MLAALARQNAKGVTIMIGTRKLALLAGIGLVAAAVAAGGVLAPGAASAASSVVPPSGLEQRGGPGGVAVDTYLLEALGITQEQYTAATTKANEAAIQQALDRGVITQAQADALKRAGSRGLGMLLRLTGSADVDQKALLAQALGITAEQLEAARVKAQEARLAQAVKDGRLTQEQADLMKARQALAKYVQEKGFYADAVAKAVQDGIITQAQADAILKATTGMRGFGFGLDFRERGGRGGHGPMRGHGGMDDRGMNGGMFGSGLPGGPARIPGTEL
jgi:hypothetical protein